jgi:Vam6/Vps39-like protein vacuolar protein sorting-associated protein 39
VAICLVVSPFKYANQLIRYCNRIHKLQTDPLARPMSRFSNLSRPTSSNTQIPDCEVDEEDSDENPSIYHTLLSLYLRPPPPNKPNLEPALDLLSKHGSRLPAASTLSLIPDDLPTKDLESYFGSRIRAANSKLAESRIVEGLRRTMLVDTQALLLLGDGVPGGQGGRNRRVMVAEERVCGVCHKRLGNSVIAVLPDNGVVHYGCLGRSGKGSAAGRSPSISSSAGRMAAGAWGRSS